MILQTEIENLIELFKTKDNEKSKDAIYVLNSTLIELRERGEQIDHQMSLRADAELNLCKWLMDSDQLNAMILKLEEENNNLKENISSIFSI